MMKNTFPALLKKELFTLLISPVSYAAVLLFFLGNTIHFFIIEQFFVLGRGSSDLRFFFNSMPYISILVIPALTMNCWSSENDFIESSPFTSTQLVLAKFFVSSFFILCAILLCTAVPVVVSFFADIDSAQCVSGFFVMILCALSYTALGIFTSVLFRSQIASFLASALILFCVNSIHLIPLYVSLPSFLSAAVRFISYAWHFDAALKGIINTQDVFFYLICTVLLLTISVFIRERRKGRVYRKLLVLLSALAFILLFITSSLYYKRFDFTKSKLFSLSKVTSEILSGAEEQIKITYYLSKGLEELYPQVRDIKDFLQNISMNEKLISLVIADPEKNENTSILSSLGIESQQIQTVKGNETSLLTVYSSIVIEYLNSIEVIPFVLSANSLEFDLVTRISTLLRGGKKTLFIAEGTELSIEQDYSYVLPWIENAGYKAVIIEEETTFENSPQSPLVVIGSSFSENMVQKIEKFIMRGGRALFFVSANKTNIYTDWSVSPAQDDSLLLSMLSYWGLSVDGGLVMDVSNYRLTMQSTDGSSYDYLNYPLWVCILPGSVFDHPITRSFAGLELYWASPLSVFSTETTTVSVPIVTSSQSYIQKPFSLTSGIDSQDNSASYLTDPYKLKTLNYASLEKKQSPVLAVLEGSVPGYFSAQKSEQTIIALIPDQYAVSNMVEYTNSAHNLDLFVNILLYISNEEELLPVKNKGTFYSLYKIENSDEFSHVQKVSYSIVFIVIPLCVVSVPFCAAGFRKKRKV